MKFVNIVLTDEKILTFFLNSIYKTRPQYKYNTTALRFNINNDLLLHNMALSQLHKQINKGSDVCNYKHDTGDSNTAKQNTKTGQGYTVVNLDVVLKCLVQCICLQNINTVPWVDEQLYYSKCVLRRDGETNG